MPNNTRVCDQRSLVINSSQRAMEVLQVLREDDEYATTSYYETWKEVNKGTDIAFSEKVLTGMLSSGSGTCRGGAVTQLNLIGNALFVLFTAKDDSHKFILIGFYELTWWIMNNRKRVPFLDPLQNVHINVPLCSQLLKLTIYISQHIVSSE